MIHFESNVLFHPSLPRFFALLEWFFSEAAQSVVTNLSIASKSSKRVPSMIPLSMGERNSHMEINWIYRLFQYCDVFLGYGLPDSQEIVSWRVVAANHPRFLPPPQISSLLAHWTKQTPQNVFEVWLTNRLVMWQELTVHDASNIDENLSSVTFQSNLVLRKKSFNLTSWLRLLKR